MSNQDDEEEGGIFFIIILVIFIFLYVGPFIWQFVTSLPVQVLVNSIFIIVTIGAWGGIHHTLSNKGIDLHPSRILLSELLPAATFSFAIVYYTYPAIVEFVMGSPPGYVSKGVFWSVMQVIGAIMITVSTVGWISLVSE